MPERPQNFDEVGDESEVTLATPRFDADEARHANPVVPLEEIPSGGYAAVGRARFRAARRRRARRRRRVSPPTRAHDAARARLRRRRARPTDADRHDSRAERHGPDTDRRNADAIGRVRAAAGRIGTDGRGRREDRRREGR